MQVEIDKGTLDGLHYACDLADEQMAEGFAMEDRAGAVADLKLARTWVQATQKLLPPLPMCCSGMYDTPRHHIADCALGQALDRVLADWQEERREVTGRWLPPVPAFEHGMDLFDTPIEVED
jgi:hypothetical protein